MKLLKGFMFLVLLFCYLMAGGCSKVEEEIPSKPKVEEVNKKEEKETKKRTDKTENKEVKEESNKDTVEQTSKAVEEKMEVPVKETVNNVPVVNEQNVQPKEEPIQNQQPVEEVPEPVQPPVIEVPACDASIPGGAYLDYNAACDAGESFLNDHWGEGYHYSVSGQTNGCGNWYYILDIYQI